MDKRITQLTQKKFGADELEKIYPVTDIEAVEGLESALSGKSPTSHTHEYSPTGHTHDDRYYTESEVDAKLAGKADTHTHPYAATNHNHQFLNTSDTRNLNASPKDMVEKNAISTHFKNRITIDTAPGAGTYNGLLAFAPWNDGSGGNGYQMSFGYSGTTPYLGIRTADLSASSWGSWNEIYHTGRKPTPEDIGALKSFKNYGSILFGHNLDDWKTEGFYQSTNETVNAPIGDGWGFVKVFYKGNSQIEQQFNAWNASQHSEYRRSFSYGSWGAWAKVYTSIDKPTAQEIGITSSTTHLVYGLDTINVDTTRGNWTTDVSVTTSGTVPEFWVTVVQHEANHFITQIAYKCESSSSTSRGTGAKWRRNKYASGSWSSWTRETAYVSTSTPPSSGVNGETWFKYD